MKQLVSLVTLGLVFGAAAPAMAQRVAHDKDAAKEIPADARPPKGMCRIWIDGVPAGQQPAPTDCSTAIRNRPSNGRVLFGDDAQDTSKANDKKRKPAATKVFTVPQSFVPRRPPGG